MPRNAWQTLEQRSADARATDGGVRDAAQPAANAWKTREQRLADARATDGVRDAARPAANAWKTLERRSADARATDWALPRSPRQTHGKHSSNGWPMLAPRMGGFRDAARPAANAWKTLERRSADARATDVGGVVRDDPRQTRYECAIRVVAAEPLLNRL